jgi:hypothetical protein
MFFLLLFLLFNCRDLRIRQPFSSNSILVLRWNHEANRTSVRCAHEAVQGKFCTHTIKSDLGCSSIRSIEKLSLLFFSKMTVFMVFYSRIKNS